MTPAACDDVTQGLTKNEVVCEGVAARYQRAEGGGGEWGVMQPGWTQQPRKRIRPLQRDTIEKKKQGRDVVPTHTVGGEGKLASRKQLSSK